MSDAADTYIITQDGLARAHGLRPDGLADNRQGRLSSAQARDLRHSRGKAIRILALAGGVMVVLGFLSWVSTRTFVTSQHSPLGVRLSGVFLILVGGALLVAGALRLARGGSETAVASVEGFVVKSVFNDAVGESIIEHGGSGGPQGVVIKKYRYDVGGQRFEVPLAAYRTLDPALRYRFFYEPTSHTLVNIEMLDHAPDATASSAPTTPYGAQPAPARGANAISAFVTPDEVSAAVGVAMVPAPGPPKQEVAGAVTQVFQDAAATLIVNVALITDAHHRGLGLWEKGMARAGTEVPGVGDQAWFANGMLLVRRAAATVTIVVRCRNWAPNDPRALPIALQLAGLVLDRLNSSAPA